MAVLNVATRVHCQSESVRESESTLYVCHAHKRRTCAILNEMVSAIRAIERTFRLCSTSSACRRRATADGRALSAHSTHTECQLLCLQLMPPTCVYRLPSSPVSGCGVSSPSASCSLEWGSLLPDSFPDDVGGSALTAGFPHTPPNSASDTLPELSALVWRQVMQRTSMYF